MVSIRTWFNGVMYKKDFIELAEMLRIHREQTSIDLTPQNRAALVDELTYSIAVIGKRLNSRFSFDKFYTAANYKGRNNA